jgi:anti-sigma regulatory factor (Ser/Thr protein kinase)
MPQARDVSATLGPAAESAHFAREVVEFVLDSLVDRDVVDTVVLLTSELVTNAVVHARTPSTLRVLVEPSVPRVRVEVADGVPQQPNRRNPSPTETSGRGLMLVDRLATHWEVDTTEAGKVVWFELAPR